MRVDYATVRNLLRVGDNVTVSLDFNRSLSGVVTGLEETAPGVIELSVADRIFMIVAGGLTRGGSSYFVERAA